MTTIEGVNTAQDTRMTDIENKNTSQDTAIAGKVSKSGDTMTGNLNFDVSSSERSLVWRGGGTDLGFVSGNSNNWRLRDWKNSKDVFSYDGTSFTINSNFKTAKDGRADLTLTADAVNFDTNYRLVAERRGNTVTVRGAIGRTDSSTNSVVTTLPTDMRPVMAIPVSTVTTDGTPITILVNNAGDINLINPTPATITGKNVFISVTYVVN